MRITNPTDAAAAVGAMQLDVLTLAANLSTALRRLDDEAGGYPAQTPGAAPAGPSTATTLPDLDAGPSTPVERAAFISDKSAGTRDDILYLIARAAPLIQKAARLTMAAASVVPVREGEAPDVPRVFCDWASHLGVEFLLGDSPETLPAVDLGGDAPVALMVHRKVAEYVRAERHLPPRLIVELWASGRNVMPSHARAARGAPRVAVRAPQTTSRAADRRRQRSALLEAQRGSGIVDVLDADLQGAE